MGRLRKAKYNSIWNNVGLVCRCKFLNFEIRFSSTVGRFRTELKEFFQDLMKSANLSLSFSFVFLQGCLVREKSGNFKILLKVTEKSGNFEKQCPQYRSIKVV